MNSISCNMAGLVLFLFSSILLFFADPVAGAHDHPESHAADGEEAAATNGDPASPGVTERLGGLVAADAVLRDEAGNPVRLGNLLATPTLLLPIYFGCPDVCNFLQANVAKILPRVDLVPGKELQIVSISFDHTETPAMAAQAKADYLHAAGPGWPPSAWRFLTGDETAVALVMDSIGFRFRRTEDQFVHPVALVALAPGGKIARYLYGYAPLPFDITMAMTEAGEGRQGLSIKRALAYCFSYDPKGKRYTLNVLRITGATVVLLGLVLFLALALGGRGKRRKKG